ncbi:MAG: hypothetical protein V7704_14010 [Aurantimonas endophytica]|uniref:hypothetical protein n=1 Tax=Aurantimonas endophytica TaxID=1522175 RepID=UPI003001D2B1
MVVSSYAAPRRRINAELRLPPSFLIGHLLLRLPSPARAALLALLPWPGDTVEIDFALDAVERHRPDPYGEVTDAIEDGLMVAEFGPAPHGATLRSIILRRL